MPLTVIGLNIDDGFIIGTGFKFTKQEGFRKFPYAALHQLQVGYAFSTGAYRIRYNGEWIKAIGNTDFIVQALAKAPNNTLNFFGRGNETVYNKTGDFKRFYRTRYSTYHFDPAFRWRSNASSFSIGPSLYLYYFDEDDNKGRFIENTSLIGSYDSLTVNKDKMHVGFVANYTRDKRNSKIFPQWGSYINIRLQTYRGITDYAKSFAQLIPEIAFYKSLNARSTIVIADRAGGVIGLGNTAFYQSAFIGGHENLLGYRQYRLAGQHSFYNNFELRMKLADIASYIIPGQFGIIGFWDAGRVWEKHDNSGKWHHGKGGGIYFAPASVLALSFVVGHSSEGLYPYFTMGLRF
jgi:outer membrane translocation and assembly module TamA